MSGKKKTSRKKAVDDLPGAIEATEDGMNDVAAETAEAADESQSLKESPARINRSGVVAWIALVVSTFAVLVVVALSFLDIRESAVDTEQGSAEMSALKSSIGATQGALSSLEKTVASLSESKAEESARLDLIGEQFRDRLQRLDSLPGRVSSVEASMTSIQGISLGARSAWLLAEAEYYMQIANAQLQLANNPELAFIALTHADDRILQLGDPRLTNVRQALADELQALEVIDKPDIAGITLTLASLAGAVDTLPLRQEVVVSDDRSKEIDPELSGMDRAIASLKNAVSGVVSVRRADEAMQPLIAPEAQYFLRANLELQLQASRLSLLRGEESVFRQSLDDADAWLAEYYDPSSTGVINARDTIARIRNSDLSVAMPDISRSLRLLRRFNALAEASQVDETGPAQ